MIKSIDFLTEHFHSYFPKHAYNYIVFLIILEDRNVTNNNELFYELNLIKQSLTKNDINLIFNFSSDLNNIDYISRLKINALRIFTPNIMKDIIVEELIKMEQYQPDDNRKEQFNLLKYYFPFKINYLSLLEPFSFSNPLIYYFLRKQLILCKTKQEMIDKLKYDEQFKSYIIQEFYNDDKDIINKEIFTKRVYKIFNELIYGLELDDESFKDIYYENFNIYKKHIKQKFGI